MFKFLSPSTTWAIGLSLPLLAVSSSDPITPKEIDLRSVESVKVTRKVPPTVKASFSPFTGKVNSDKACVRLQSALDGYIVCELNKNEYVSVLGQEGEYYSIQPSTSTKAYIFRGFVIDGIVEGNQVNVRLQPNLEAPIIGHVNSGDRVNGAISSLNRKWLEIEPPASTSFYVSKKLIDYAGNPELKAKMAKRKETVEQLLEGAQLYADQEFTCDFEDIDFEQVKERFLTIIHEYTDFPKNGQLAKKALAKTQEKYLQKRIAYLEKKAAIATSGDSSKIHCSLSKSPLRMWDAIEEGLFAKWSQINDNRPMDDFYEEERLAMVSISGVLETFKSPVNNKPGDYIIKRKHFPIAYVYSTKVNLEDYVGKQVTVLGSPRSNNHFAFPAYFIHEMK